MKSQPLSLNHFIQNKIDTSKVSKRIRGSNPFRIVLHKEMADHIRSWRFIVLIVLIALTFIGSMYVSLGNIRSTISNTNDPDHNFLYLKLLTATDNSIPPFHVFLSFLGPLLGISLGFDAINAEQNNGTLTRVLAQPIYRDNLLLAKFLSAMIMVSTLFLTLILLMIGGGLVLTGVRMEPLELWRILGFILISIIYVGFWLSLSIVLSIKFRQAATSALTAIGIWLFFTVFYQIILNLVIRSVLPDPSFLSQDQIQRYNEFILDLLRIAPNQLYTDASTTMLMPSVRSLGPLTMEKMAGAIPAPLPFKESLMIVWPQVSGLIGATSLFFALSYYLFMRKEIRNT
ncbi:ABC transporter permease subunit [Pedobacter gandavensis]|uniref:ABC transporter permease n=1 Tax=Pedobacter TaxID=84567 RepID=UPI001C9991C6|nr:MULTISPECIES: ABC transporter permease subunit [Pedobacter]WGQ10168.1 ABC transporter permease subunit [Pedobacter gandavensis]